jgi:hypothetical protein
MFVWKQCEGSTIISKVYPVTIRFILDELIVAYKEIEHCFHSCAAVCTGISLVVLFSASNVATKIFSVREKALRKRLAFFN